jgi:hypothetical protein
MYAPLGCYTENVEEPGQLKGVIERAVASGKTSVINVMGSRDVFHPLYNNVSSKEMFWHLPADEIEAPARERHIQEHYPRFHAGQMKPANTPLASTTLGATNDHEETKA